MNRDGVLLILRKLAKRPEYQNIYSSEKLNLKIFENEIDLTELQYNFLAYLSFYSSLYMDIALNDIDEKVLENNIFEDAYMYYKRNKKEEKPKIQKETYKGNQRGNQIPITTSKWIFRNKKK